jgi:hypothetical protein
MDRSSKFLALMLLGFSSASLRANEKDAGFGHPIGSKIVPEKSSIPSLYLSTLIPNDIQDCDKGFASCVGTSARSRVNDLLQISLMQTRVEDRFEGFRKSVESNPTMSDSAFAAGLENIWAETDKELKSVQENFQGENEALKLAESEIARTRSELAVRLAMLALGSGQNERKNTVQKYLQLAGLWQSKARQLALDIPAATRETFAPGLMGRLAMTHLFSEQMSLLQENSGNIKSFDRFDDVVKRYEVASAGPLEKQHVRMVRAEAWLSLAKTATGQSANTIGLDFSRQARFKAFAAELGKNALTLEDADLRARSQLLAEEMPFFTGGRFGREDHLALVRERLKTDDADSQRVLRQALADVAEHNVGTAFAEELFRFAKNDAELSPMMEQARVAHQEIGHDYDASMIEALGAENHKKLGFASFAELTRSQGSLSSLQHDYSQRLVSFSALAQEYQKTGDKKMLEQIADHSGALDIYWARIQCHRYRMGTVPMEKGGDLIEAPFKSFKINLDACRIAPGASYVPNEANAVVNDIIDKGIIRKRNVDVAWVAGEFAFDVVTVIGSGGAVMLVKAPLKAGIKKAATTALKKGVMKPVVVKAAARGTSFVAQGAVIDLTTQSVGASRAWLEAGLRGEWDSHHFTDNVTYLKGDVSAAQHLTRLMASSLAARGMDAVWKGVSKVSALPAIPKALGAKVTAGILQSSVNTMVGAQIKPLVDVSMGQDSSALSGSLGKLVSGEEWVKAFQSSLEKKVKGTMSQKIGGDSGLRYFGKNLVEITSPLKFTEAEVNHLKNLEKCLQGSIKEASTLAPPPVEPTPPKH